MLKKTSYFVLTFILLSCSLFASTLPKFNADGVILIEPTTNTILYSKNGKERFYPASTTKILTALAILEDLSPNAFVTKSQDSIDSVPSDSSHIGLQVGDQYSVLDGLYAVLMASDNFVCHDLAIKDSGSIEAFADRMNHLALELGATSSHFVNPHGYHDENHYTTPYDLAQIARGAFNHPLLSKIASTPNYNVRIQNANSVIPITHTSMLLNKNSDYYNPHVISSKTGYHTPAGRTLVAKAVYDNIELIGIVMRTETPYQFEDMNALFEYGAANYSLSTSDNGQLYVDNHTYSEWAKPYVTYALDKGWITNTSKNYTTTINKRAFLNLLYSVLPNSYGLQLDRPTIDEEIAISKDHLTLTRQETAQILYNFLSKFNLTRYNFPLEESILDLDSVPPSLQKAITFCTATHLMNVSEGYFNPNEGLTYEEALYTVYMLDQVISRYENYSLETALTYAS